MSGSSQIPLLLWQRRWTFVLTALAVFAGVVALTFSLPRVYTSTAYLLVSPGKTVSSDFEATQLTQLLTKTYSELLQGDSVSREVDRRLGTHDAADALQVTAVPDSQLLSLEGSAGTPGQAQVLTNTFGEVFIQRIRGMRDAGESAGDVAVAEPASLPTGPSRPRPALYLSLGALLAALAGLGAALLRERLDQRLIIDSATTELFGLSILGRLPRAVARTEGERALAEAARLLLANLTFANLGDRPRSVAIVSASEQEGKSTTSLSLGRAGAELRLEVLLVEADLRRPSLAGRLGLRVSPGTGFGTALVRPETEITEQTVTVAGSTLEILPAGPPPPNPAALLGSERLAEFEKRTHDPYDFVIYDTPPLAAGADASFIASGAEGVLLVIDASRTRRNAVLQAVEQLKRVRANVLGVVVNRAPDAMDRYYYGDAPEEPLPEPAVAASGKARPRAPRR
jgi:succinoglycan biosynthesis transport protein ExoP